MWKTDMKFSVYPALALCFLFMACSEEEPDGIIPDPEPEPVVCDQDICWDSRFYVCRDTFYNDLFTRDQGWTGGDATYSVELDNGRRVWLFGDTFIDQVNADRSRSGFRLINNSLMLQQGDELTTYHGGTSAQPAAFATPPEEGHWYWPGDGTFTGSSLFLFMHGFANDTGEAWDFYRTSVDLLELDPADMSVIQTTRILDDTDISWGAAVLEADEVVYIYGVKSEGIQKDLYVARSGPSLALPWEYYSEDGWTSDRSQAAPIAGDVSEQFSVFRSGGSYYLLTQHNLFGKEIYLYESDSPAGEFNNRKTVYCTPETGGDIFTYNAFLHTGAYQDSLLISYNVNSFDLQDLLESADNYRPYFIKIPMF